MSPGRSGAQLNLAHDALCEDVARWIQGACSATARRDPRTQRHDGTVLPCSLAAKPLEQSLTSAGAVSIKPALLVGILPQLRFLRGTVKQEAAFVQMFDTPFSVVERFRGRYGRCDVPGERQSLLLRLVG